MYRAENFGESWLEVFLPFPCEIHHCRGRRRPDRSVFSVLTHYTEPRQTKWPPEIVRRHAGAFNLILTNEESLLDLPNACFAVFGGCWVRGTPNEKRFELSFLYSNGAGDEARFAGYRARRVVWDAQSSIRMPKVFYTSRLRPPPGLDHYDMFPFEEKTPLFESMFSVVIENDPQPHYFTEKIIDALRTYTVPLYLGAPNIGKYFDMRGILAVKSPQELIEIANRLTAQDYWQRLPAIMRNYELAEGYADEIGNMRDYIIEGHRRLASRDRG